MVAERVTFHCLRPLGGSFSHEKEDDFDRVGEVWMLWVHSGDAGKELMLRSRFLAHLMLLLGYLGSLRDDGFVS